VTDSSRRDPGGLFTAALAAFTVALSSTNALPLIVGSLIDGMALGEDAAGLLGSLELGAMALGTLALAPGMDRISRRGLARVACLAAAAAHVASAFADGFVSVAALRTAAGLAEGGVLAAANAAVASSLDPDRLFARVTIGGGLAAALLLAALPPVIEWGEHRGAFLALGALSLACLPLLRWLPGAPAREERSGDGRAIQRGLALALLVGGFLLAAGEGAIWAFSERIGLRVGLSAEAIGIALGAATLVGLLGAAAAAWLGASRGRSAPIAVGVAVTGASCLALAYTLDPSAYVVLQLVFGVAYMFSLPYLMGAAAALDPMGRVAAGLGGISLVAAAAGPGAGGLLLTWGSYPMLGWVALVGALLAIVAILPAALALDRGRTSDARALDLRGDPGDLR
jgi:predicted MFS family arabinose efflux permease